MSTSFATPLGLVLEPREMVARCAEDGLRVELVARPDEVGERSESLGKPLVAEALWGRVRLTRQRNGEVRQNPTYRGDGRRASFWDARGRVGESARRAGGYARPFSCIRGTKGKERDLFEGLVVIVAVAWAGGASHLIGTRR
jgi:hypothetical protein